MIIEFYEDIYGVGEIEQVEDAFSDVDIDNFGVDIVKSVVDKQMIIALPRTQKEIDGELYSRYVNLDEIPIGYINNNPYIKSSDAFDIEIGEIVYQNSFTVNYKVNKSSYVIEDSNLSDFILHVLELGYHVSMDSDVLSVTNPY